MTLIKKTNDWIAKRAQLMFLLSLLSSVVLLVFFKRPEIREFMENIFSSLIIISAIYLLTASADPTWLARMTGFLALAGIWLDFLLSDIILINSIIFIASAVFYVMVFRYLFIIIFRSNRVSENVIIASISGYILLGLIGALLCRIVYLNYPESYFQSNEVLAANGFQNADFVYYSFVTLTTLGYGDIVPSSVQSRALAIFLSLAGQLYLTILIAIIIGKYLRDQSNES